MAVQIILKNSSAEDKRPTEPQLANGEIALNYNAAGAFLTCRDTDGNIQQVGGVKISEVAPDNPVKQTLWFQPSSLTLFVYDGDSFLPIAGGGGGGTPGGGITTIIGNNGIDASEVAGVVTLDVELHGGDDGLEFRDSKLKASVASASQLGSVKVGDAISVTGDGTITPRIASASQTGIVKIGDGIDVAGDGTISVEIPQALTFKGSVDLNNPPTGQVELPNAVGDAYVNSATANPVDNGWVGIGGEVAQAGDLVVWDGSQWEIIGTGGTPDVDLGYTAAADQGTVTNSAGDDAVIPIADDTNAGLFTAAEKTKLEGIEDGANVGMTEVNLNYAPNGDSDGTVQNDAGNDATIPVAIASNSSAIPATAGVAGLFTGAEKEKLAGIEDGATNEGTNDGRYLRKDSAAGDQTVASTGTTTFNELTSHGGGVKVTGGFTESSITYGVFSSIADATDTYNFYAAGSAPNFFKGDTYIGGSVSRNTRELWESTLTEEQKEQLAAGTLVVPANVATPGDGEFARQWWYDQQDEETQALIDAGELDYPEHFAAATFTDTFALGDSARINLTSDKLEIRTGASPNPGLRWYGAEGGIHCDADSNFVVKNTLFQFNNLNDERGVTIIDDKIVIGDAGGDVRVSLLLESDVSIQRSEGSQDSAAFGVLNQSNYGSMSDPGTGNTTISQFTSAPTVGNVPVDQLFHYNIAETAGKYTQDPNEEYGFYSRIEDKSGKNNYNFYAAGPAPNYFKGEVRGGGTDGENPTWTIAADGTATGITVTRAAVVTDEQAGTVETLLDIITDLRARVEALEAAATS